MIQAEPSLTTSFRYLISPVHFARECLGTVPDQWQEDVLMSSAKRILLNCCRQSGKSTTSAILALHTAVYHPGSLILVISPSLRQSRILFKKITDFRKMLKPRPVLFEDNKLSTTFANGSQIVALPGTEGTIRGYSSVALILEDEAAKVSDDTYLSTRPMLAISNGRHILMSTPFGKRGHFFEEWENGGKSWVRIEIPAPHCPRISEEFLQEEFKSLGDWWFSQEYLCQFRDTTDSLFKYDQVMESLDDDLEIWAPENT
jgi:hypothetical protein